MSFHHVNPGPSGPEDKAFLESHKGHAWVPAQQREKGAFMKKASNDLLMLMVIPKVSLPSASLGNSLTT